jgi:benzylsuccinate CoA-transferase BbsE subunit
MSALKGIRVLDLSGEKGEYCTKLLADMGAEVILLEKPGGNENRSLEPYLDDIPHPERSLHFFYFNNNKKSITLNIEDTDGIEIFKNIVPKIDIILEAFPSGKMKNLGLGYDRLLNINKGLIMASLTGFGQTGPRKEYAWNDLIAQAMGGLLFISGNPEEPPACLPGSISYLQVSLNAVVGMMIALIVRDREGEGQHVDISAQEAMAMTIEGVPYDFYFNSHIHTRQGGKAGAPRGIFRCKDGYIACNAHRIGWEALVDWLKTEGMAKDLVEDRWKNPKIREQGVEHVNHILKAFFQNYTKEELYHEAQKRRIPFCPVNTPEEINRDEQLGARNFFIRVEHPELSKDLIHPGTPLRLSNTPCKISKRAPLVGENNSEIYGEWLGMTRRDLEALKGNGVI